MSDACPACSELLAPASRWCESCGTRRAGVEVCSWTAEVTADREWFDQVGMSDVVFPPRYPARRFTLREGESTVGRRSTRRGIEPEVDLGGAPEDPGVSRLHAVLAIDERGDCSITDLGSTNGTYVDGSSVPLEVGVAAPVLDGAIVRVGAWTAITLRRND